MARYSRSRRYRTAAPLALGRTRLRRSGSRRRLLAGWLRATLLIVTLIGVVVALWLTLDDRFYVYDASIVGADGVMRESVLRASRLPGIHIFWVRSSDVVSNILAGNPGLESATVTCRLPADCTIAVVERQPLIVWEDAGQVWCVDEAGLATPSEGSLPSGWLVRGQLPLKDDNTLDEPVRVGLEELWAAGVDMTQVMYYTPELGLVFVDQRGWRVAVGVGRGMAPRLEALEQVAANLQARGVTPGLVDVHLPNAPYYTESEG